MTHSEQSLNLLYVLSMWELSSSLPELLLLDSQAVAGIKPQFLNN